MIIKDDPSFLAQGQSALLINPPIYDTQYWAKWSQPHGLLKVATWLKESYGYKNIRLLDCLATDQNRKVNYRRRPGEDGTKKRGNISRHVNHYGWSWEKLRFELERHARREKPYPDEVWITSILTYWWESTRDLILLIEDVFKESIPRIYVGGIYPTLYPEHANKHLGRDTEVVVVEGEICPEAANSWTDLSLYYDDDVYETKPKYALITGSRGCPFNCAYCAQLKLNDGNRKVRYRTPHDIAAELEWKQRKYGVNELAFYEDNLLFSKLHTA